MRRTSTPGLRRFGGAAMLLMALAAAGCSDDQRIPAAIQVVEGDGQTRTVGQELPDLLQVRVEDAMGLPVEGARVVWSTEDGAGTITPVSDRTDATGRAAARWTLGEAQGRQQAKAEVAPGVSAPFGAYARPGPGSAVTLHVDTVRFTALWQSQTLFASEVDRFGNIIVDAAPAEWRSLDEQVFTAEGLNTGVIRSRGNGSSHLVVTIPVTGSRTDSVRAVVPVIVRQEPASVSISADAASANTALDGAYLVNVGDTLALQATINDANGSQLREAVPEWLSTEPQIVTVSSGGLVLAVSPGDAGIIASRDSLSDTVKVRVITPVPPPIGWHHTGTYELRTVNSSPLPYTTNYRAIPSHHIASGGIVLGVDGTYRWWSEGTVYVDSFERRGTYRVLSDTTAQLDRGPAMSIRSGVLSMPECGAAIECLFLRAGLHAPSLTYTYYRSEAGGAHKGRVWLMEDGRYFRQVYHNYAPWYYPDHGSYNMLVGDGIILIPGTELRVPSEQPLTGTLVGARLTLGDFVYLEQP